MPCENKRVASEPQVYVPQNTTVPQNTSFFYFSYKILGKHAIYFIFVNIYIISFSLNEHIKAKNGYFHKNLTK